MCNIYSLVLKVELQDDNLVCKFLFNLSVCVPELECTFAVTCLCICTCTHAHMHRGERILFYHSFLQIDRRNPQGFCLNEPWDSQEQKNC